MVYWKGTCIKIMLCISTDSLLDAKRRDRTREREKWEMQSKATHYTHFTKAFWLTKWFRYLTSFLNWFYALPCFEYFLHNARELKYFSTIYQAFLEDMRGILFIFFSFLHHHNLGLVGFLTLAKYKKSICISEPISEVNQAWNKHEAWVCQGDKNYLRVLKLDNRIIEDNDSIKSDEKNQTSWSFQSSTRWLFNDSDSRTRRRTSRLIPSIITSAIYTTQTRKLSKVISFIPWLILTIFKITLGSC